MIKDEIIYPYFFKNRKHAGELLAQKLKRFQGESGIVLAVPRGGVPVAYPIAVELGSPLELILAKKISHPHYKEFAIGAASLDDYFVLPQHKVTKEYIEAELKRIRTRPHEMQAIFMDEKPTEDLKGKTIIVIDDGVATGHTMQATLQLLLKKHPAKIIVAVPVATQNAVDNLSMFADEVIVLEIPYEFHGVGSFYEDFKQVTDEEVIHYLNLLRTFRKTA